MSWLFAPALLLPLLALVPTSGLASLTRTEQARLLEEVRGAVLEYSSKMPNFLCHATIRREWDFERDGSWQLDAVIETRVSYSADGEKNQIVSVNGRTPTAREIESVGRELSWGEFAADLHNIFHPNTEARFQWIGQEQIAGRAVHVIAFSVSKEHSTWEVGRDRPVCPAYQGRIFVALGANLPLRLELLAGKLPRRLGIRRAVTVIEYDYVDIAGTKHLLAKRAASELILKEGAYRDEKVFHDYRRFAADSQITFSEGIR